MTGIYKIVYVGDPITITKKDGTSCRKQTITLRELGGKYEDQYAVSWLGEKIINLNVGATIVGALRFSVRNYEGQDYQDILLQEYVVVDANYGIGQLPRIPSI